jgi:hypothetical protein
MQQKQRESGWGLLLVQQGQRVRFTVSATGTEGGVNVSATGTEGQRLGLTVSASGTEGGAYCECNRDRSWGLL